MTTRQPEALDLADWLIGVGGGPSAQRAAALLRSQHARITELEAQLEAVGAGGVGPLIADAGFDAADMATAAAQGFRDGVASVAHQPITDTNTASVAAIREIEDCPELNLSNYGSDDVDRLNDWAIRADEEIDRLRAALASTPAQPAAENARGRALRGQAYPTIGDLCARIKAADDAAADRDYMLDSNDCIAVLRGEWKGPLTMDKPDRASHGQAPADSVQEDAARYRWLREQSSTLFVNISINGEGAEIAETLDSAVDAARKQGKNHD